MDSTLFSNLGSIGFSVGAVIAPVTFLLFARFIRWRTGSYFTVLSRLWTIFHGKSTESVPAIKHYLVQQAAVDQLSFVTGLRVRTPQQAARLLMWGEKHEESLADIGRCGPYFDAEQACLKDRDQQPGKPAVLVAGAAFLALVLAAILTLQLVAYDKPLLRMKATGTWLSLTPTEATPFLGAPLPLDRCKEQSLPGGFAPAEARLICTIFGSEPENERKSYVARTLSDQRRAAAFLLALWITLSYPLYKLLSYGSNANDMRERLRKKALHREQSAAADETSHR